MRWQSFYMLLIFIPSSELAEEPAISELYILNLLNPRHTLGQGGHQFHRMPYGTNVNWLRCPLAADHRQSL
jgi:hypothetical protein